GRRWTLRKVLRVVAASETTGVPRCQHRRHLEIAAAKMSPCPEGCGALPRGGALSNEGVVLASYPPRLGGDRENSPEKARQNGGSDAQGAPPVQGRRERPESGVCGPPRLFGTLARVPGVVVVQETRAALHVKVEPAAVRSVLDLMGAYRP